MLENIEPKKVFKYFEEICNIPHGSYHTDKIADYAENFAKQHKLEYTRDAHNNIVIYKKASADYKGDSTVIIQGHLDMVCAKDEETEIDFEKQGVNISHNDKYIFANGTTLGGDDGIAIAMALAVLDSDKITHPNLECVFTTDEEVGMLGASAMNMSKLKGKYMLNIDSEDEGEFTVSCAGGETLVAEFELKENQKQYSECIDISVNGLLGGHSGVEIDKGRANAIILMGKLLDKITQSTDSALVEITGGQKDNAIPFECYASINTNNTSKVFEIIDEYKNKIINRYKGIERAINICAEKSAIKTSCDCNIIQFLSNVTNGVKSMSGDIENLVQTSSNLGIIRKEENKIITTFSLRSSVEKEKKELHNEIKSLAESYGAKVSSFGEYPAWEYKQNSRLQQLCKDIYKKQYKKDAKTVAIHAGLECGIFCGKIPNLDCISFGPNILNIHTSKERLDIASVQRVYIFLLELLSQL